MCGDMYEANLLDKLCKPIYWTGEEVTVYSVEISIHIPEKKQNKGRAVNNHGHKLSYTVTSCLAYKRDITCTCPKHCTRPLDLVCFCFPCVYMYGDFWETCSTCICSPSPFSPILSTIIYRQAVEDHAWDLVRGAWRQVVSSGGAGELSYRAGALQNELEKQSELNSLARGFTRGLGRSIMCIDIILFRHQT